jgi:zinc transport system substrate-binding protein
MMRRAVAAAIAAALSLPVAACGSAGADDGAPRVVAALYPLQYVAERVGAEHVAVTTLSPPGVEAHDLELTPRQVAAVAEADLVVYVGGFQPAVDDAVAAHQPAALDVTDTVPLLRGDVHDHAEPGDEHAAEEDHEPAGDPDGHQPTDPHVWLDPLRLATIADEVADRLATVDPAHASAYADNAARLRDDLAALDAEYARGLADCARREIVVSHAAFGYLADRYRLTQVTVAGLSPEDEPTPQRLAEAVSLAREHGATTIFFETLASDRVARVIAEASGATTAVLDPIEGLTPGSTEDYGSLMRANLAALRAALDCR